MAKRDKKRSTTARPNDSRIRERAYELYVERGDGPGDELDDWLRAEREYQQRADGEDINSDA